MAYDKRKPYTSPTDYGKAANGAPNNIPLGHIGLQEAAMLLSSSGNGATFIDKPEQQPAHTNPTTGWNIGRLTDIVQVN